MTSPARIRLGRASLAPSAALAAILWLAGAAAYASDPAGETLLPALSDVFRVLTFQDYNTRVVIIGATLLGLAGGLIGTFLLLRKRALLSDTLSHAALPGIVLAFIIGTALGGRGKNLMGLIAGAAVFSVLGTGTVILIQRWSRLKDDAALGIVLSAFVGLGIALLGIATRMESGNAAGLNSFIYGKTASMLFFDAVLIAGAALACVLICLLFFKEFTLICFDTDFAASQGWPVTVLDFFMMSLAVVVTVIGMQAVGLILVVALLIIPPAAARFWTHDLRAMLWISGFFGALSGLLGSGMSALMANLPAGAVIVVTAASLFLISLGFGTARGLLRVQMERWELNRKIASENLLRAMYEGVETCMGRMDTDACIEHSVAFIDLMMHRSWSTARLRQALRDAIKRGWIAAAAVGDFVLTPDGLAAARQVVRKHRLWEAYLIAHADIAPGQVDWGADAIEHILDPEMIRSLEAALPDLSAGTMPESPHLLHGARENA